MYVNSLTRTLRAKQEILRVTGRVPVHAVYWHAVVVAFTSRHIVEVIILSVTLIDVCVSGGTS